MNIFSRLLKLYKTNNIKTPLEDFTTEILAGILNDNPEICDSFVNDILEIDGKEFEVSTQNHYLLDETEYSDCRVDLVIRSANMLCFIENKVEAKEGYAQLERYAKVLKSCEPRFTTYLRYCTKYYDKKDINHHDFRQFRWADISRFLRDWQHIDTIEKYLEFLELHNMSDNMDFTLNDLVCLQNINPVIKKMTDYLSKFESLFKSIFNNYALKNNDVTVYKQIKFYSQCVNYTGDVFGSGWSQFGWGFKFSDSYTPYILIWLQCNHENSKTKEFKEAIDNLNGMNLNIIEMYNDNWIELGKYLSDFLGSETMEEDIEKWFINSFNIFKQFILKTPQLEWHIGLV